MWGKLKLAGLAALLLGLTSGCRVCERWYERNHDPNENRRPYYYAPSGGYCPPGCAPAAPACPPGCAPAGYGSGFAPPVQQCPPGCVPG